MDIVFGFLCVLPLPQHKNNCSSPNLFKLSFMGGQLSLIITLPCAATGDSECTPFDDVEASIPSQFVMILRMWIIKLRNMIMMNQLSVGQLLLLVLFLWCCSNTWSKLFWPHLRMLNVFSPIRKQVEGKISDFNDGSGGHLSRKCTTHK